LADRAGNQILSVTDLLSLFEQSLVGRAGRPAIEVGGRTCTFGEVQTGAGVMAAALRDRGVVAGDRVVVHLPNGLAFVELFLACLRTGAIMVPANVLYKEREVAHIIGDADPRLVITEDPSLFASGTPVARPTELAHADRAGNAVTTGAATAAPLTNASPALMIYTSGTTGRPKGAVLTHGNITANTKHLLDAWRVTASDRYLGALPLFHVHGLGNGLCSWLASGCLMRLEERFDNTKAPGWFEAFQPTLFFGVPTMYVRMLEWPDDVARRIGARMRLFVCGSAPLPSHVMDAFEAKFGHTILERYGMSETLMNMGNPYDRERRPGSVGIPFRDVQARIVDENGAPVPTGTVGQLEVRGPNVFHEYWRNPDATARAFREGWFRTGDMAEVGEDGYFTLRGRGTDLIISGGFNIYPREIEEVLLEQEGVREVAVVGVNDARRGEVPVAYVVADVSATDDALRDACARGLASFKVPRAFVRVDSLPRTALGKVQKHLLPPWNP
jgi:malonyl-CoA/methylmalonyl-CoA synthetase